MTRTRALVCVIIVLALGMGLLTYGVLHTAARVSQQTREALRLAKAIQAERVDAIGTACREQNARNAAAIAALHRNASAALTDASLMHTQQLLAAIGIHATLDAVRRFAVLSSSGSSQTIQLINALAPSQDCRIVVRRATH